MKSPFELIAPFEVKSIGDSLVIEGYASTWHDRDRHRDTIDPQAFDESIERYMQNPVVLAFHDPTRPIGRVTQASLDEKGLYVVAEVKKSVDPQLTVVYDQIKSGVLRAFSIGGFFTRLSEAKGQKIIHVDLHEISVVATPANPFAGFTVNEAMEKSFDAYETKSAPIFEHGQAVAFSTLQQAMETKQVMEETFAPKPTMPKVDVVIEGVNTPDFMGFYFGTKAVGSQIARFSIQANDAKDLEHRLQRLTHFVDRTGVRATIHAPFSIPTLEQ